MPMMMNHDHHRFAAAQGTRAYEHSDTTATPPHDDTFAAAAEAYTRRGLAPMCLHCGSADHLYNACRDYGVTDGAEVAVYCAFLNVTRFMPVPDWTTARVSQLRDFVSMDSGVPVHSVMLLHGENNVLVADSQSLSDAGVGVGSVVYAFVAQPQPQLYQQHQQQQHHYGHTFTSQCIAQQADQAYGTMQLHHEVARLTEAVMRLLAAQEQGTKRADSQPVSDHHAAALEPPSPPSTGRTHEPDTTDARTPTDMGPPPPPPPASMRCAWGDMSMDTTFHSTPNTPAAVMPSPILPSPRTAARAAQLHESTDEANTSVEELHRRAHDPLRTTVHVKGVPSDMREDDLQDFLCGYGTVLRLLLVKAKEQKPFTFAFVEFAVEYSAKLLVKSSGTCPAAFQGVQIHCSMAKSAINARMHAQQQSEPKTAKAKKKAKNGGVVDRTEFGQRTIKAAAPRAEEGTAKAPTRNMWLSHGPPKMGHGLTVPAALAMFEAARDALHDATQAGGAKGRLSAALTAPRRQLVRAAGQLLAVAATRAPQPQYAKPLRNAALEAQEVAMALKNAHGDATPEKAEIVLLLIALHLLADDTESAMSCAHRYIMNLVEAANDGGGWGVVGDVRMGMAAHLVLIGLVLEERGTHAAAGSQGAFKSASQSFYAVTSRIVPQYMTTAFGALVRSRSSALCLIDAGGPTTAVVGTQATPIACRIFTDHAALAHSVDAACFTATDTV